MHLKITLALQGLLSKIKEFLLTLLRNLAQLDATQYRLKAFLVKLIHERFQLKLRQFTAQLNLFFQGMEQSSR
jgi:hypothetical protein